MTSRQKVRPASDGAGLRGMTESLEGLRSHMLALEAEHEETLESVHAGYQSSARNLVRYLALRHHDLRQLQAQLNQLGLSSLGRSEIDTLRNLDAVIRVLKHVDGHQATGWTVPAPVEGRSLLDEHTDDLFGPRPEGRRTRIMVTLPTAAATEYAFVQGLVRAGMNCVRINCAYDGPPVWEGMVRNVRRAAQELERPCTVMMDLAGPKLRTGPMAPGSQVATWRPHRDEHGAVTAPAHIWLTPAAAPVPPPPGADSWLPVPGDWLARLETGHRIEFKDLRGKKRQLEIVDAAGASRWATAGARAWVGPGTRLQVRIPRAGRSARKESCVELGDLPPRADGIFLRPGDSLLLTRDLLPGIRASYDGAGNLVRPARIACASPEIFGRVRPGEPVFFDDGKIGGVIRSATPEELRVEITQTTTGGAKLRGDKGINLPESDLQLSGLTEKDRRDLAFMAQHADAVELSFAEHPADIAEVQDYLAAGDGGPRGLVLKIETRRGFERLPALMLAAMRGYPVGVMIARGDLGVECGYQRLAEVQEEMLWLCEAARLPVIWATQVLETMAKKGLPSRAEITDAAMAQRAECVMLNKGPFIVQTVAALDDILRRMEAHQSKKSALLRELRLSGGL